MNNDIGYDTDVMKSIMDRIGDVKKNNDIGKKPLKPKNKVKRLTFEINEKDSTLTKAVKKRLNAGHFTKDQLDEFCLKLPEYANEPKKATDKATNMKYGLNDRHTMIDETFELWCEFMDLDILLVERNK